MGLDMFLYAEQFVSQMDWSQSYDKELTDVLSKRFPEASKEGSFTISHNIMYWRKSNAIHKWFVDNVQKGKDDCGRYLVKYDDLFKFIEVGKAIIADHSQAEKLMPTTEGFYYGGTEYDDVYFKELQEAVNLFERLTQDVWAGYTFYYSSSW